MPTRSRRPPASSPRSEPVGGAGEEVGAAAEDEPGAHDDVLVQQRPDELLPRQLRASVDGQRRRRRRSRRRARPSRRRRRSRWRRAAARRRTARAASARFCGPIALSRTARAGSRLAGVHLRERGEVHHGVGGDRRHRGHHRVVIADVELGSGERVHVVMRRHLREERPRQAAAGAGDQEPHAPVPAGLGAVTTSTVCAARIQSRCSRYHSTVRSRPSSNATSGAQPSERRRSAPHPVAEVVAGPVGHERRSAIGSGRRPGAQIRRASSRFDSSCPSPML